MQQELNFDKGEGRSDAMYSSPEGEHQIDTPVLGSLTPTSPPPVGGVESAKLIWNLDL